jgi:hypothetical protein
VRRVPVAAPGHRNDAVATILGDAGVEKVNEVAARVRAEFVTRLGFGELLHVKTTQH